jgi:hypothetical protein
MEAKSVERNEARLSASNIAYILQIKFVNWKYIIVMLFMVLIPYW